MSWVLILNLNLLVLKIWLPSCQFSYSSEDVHLLSEVIVSPIFTLPQYRRWIVSLLYGSSDGWVPRRHFFINKVDTLSLKLYLKLAAGFLHFKWARWLIVPRSLVALIMLTGAFTDTESLTSGVAYQPIGDLVESGGLGDLVGIWTPWGGVMRGYALHAGSLTLWGGLIVMAVHLNLLEKEWLLLLPLYNLRLNYVWRGGILE